MMFVVEGYVEVTEEFDTNTNKFIPCKPYLVNPCGSDYCIIIHDLKTLRGVKNRMAEWRWSDAFVEVRVYTVTNIFDRETYNLQYIKPLKGNKTSIQKLTEERKRLERVKCQLSI